MELLKKIIFWIDIIILGIFIFFNLLVFINESFWIFLLFGFYYAIFRSFCGILHLLISVINCIENNIKLKMDKKYLLTIPSFVTSLVILILIILEYGFDFFDSNIISFQYIIIIIGLPLSAISLLLNNDSKNMKKIIIFNLLHPLNISLILFIEKNVHIM
jgi:hypothetical protein